MAASFLVPSIYRKCHSEFRSTSEFQCRLRNVAIDHWFCHLDFIRRGAERIILLLQLLAELLGVEPVVVAALLQQFGVGAHLGDAAILDDQDAVRVADGARAGGR